jgi:hypothetical protein
MHVSISGPVVCALCVIVIQEGPPFRGRASTQFRTLEAVWLVVHCMQLREAFQALQAEYKVHTETAKAEVIGEPPQGLL